MTGPNPPILVSMRMRRRTPEETIARFDEMIANVPADAVVAIPRADVQELVDAIRDSRREAQAVWRCSISDFVGCLDLLRDRWIASRRKAEREAGAELAAVLDVVYAGRNPAPSDHSSAEKAGRGLIERVRQALTARATASAAKRSADAKPR